MGALIVLATIAPVIYEGVYQPAQKAFQNERLALRSVKLIGWSCWFFSRCIGLGGGVRGGEILADGVLPSDAWMKSLFSKKLKAVMEELYRIWVLDENLPREG